VHVTRIPVDPPAEEAPDAEDTAPTAKGPDDTSTAAISVINIKQG